MSSSQRPSYLLIFNVYLRRTDGSPKKQRESSIGQKMGHQPHGAEDFDESRENKYCKKTQIHSRSGEQKLWMKYTNHSRPRKRNIANKRHKYCKKAQKGRKWVNHMEWKTSMREKMGQTRPHSGILAYIYPSYNCMPQKSYMLTLTRRKLMK